MLWQKQFEALCKGLRDMHYEVVAAIGWYPGRKDQTSAYFSTHLLLSGATETEQDLVVRMSLASLMGVPSNIERLDRDARKEEAEELVSEITTKIIDENSYLFWWLTWHDGLKRDYNSRNLQSHDAIHEQLDLAREIIVSWSNMRHDGQLAWIQR